jgi:hypothetical protein
MKQHETIEKEINGNKFYIRPFAAWTSIRVHADLIGAVTPLISPVVPLLGSGSRSDIMNFDVSSFIKAMSSLSGEKIEELLKKLLTKYDNISVETEDGVKKLDDDLVNEIFCGEAQDIFVLAWEVIRSNFPSISKKTKDLFGNQKVTDILMKLTNTAD